MHDQCPMETRIATLERRVENNEKKSSETHKEFYNRVRELEKNAAVRNEQYDTILDKLENLTGTVGTLAQSMADIQSKPGKRWEAIVDKSIWAVLAAVLAFVLARVGL